MTEHPPWLEVAQPRDDIADGSFDESLFAADLGMVAEGHGPRDYLDAATFAEKTFLTANLQAFLDELGRRLGGDPTSAGVYRMQTEFGGGKTHTLLAAFHVFGDPDSVRSTDLGAEIAAMLPGGAIPKARVVVLDGSALSVTPAETPDGCTLTTLLGHLAYRLGGKAAWDKVADADRSYQGSSTVQLAKLLAEHSPCLILMDEALEYLNKGLTVKAHDGNLATTTLTFVKELTTAVANTPTAALVATLTSSRMEDYATVAGEEMQERLSKVVGRAENIVTPVEGDDIFPILHRRLFSTIGTEEQRRQVAEAYTEYYREMGDALPSSYGEQSYRDRITHAYPFHPELVDILTNRWGSLSGFQRTRGALRTLAHTVKALAQSRSKGSLILPGDVPLADAGVRAEVIRFAGESYKAALNADIIRPDSKSPEEDRRRGGAVQEHSVAKGLATTAFLDSFGPDKVVGASGAQMLLGVGRPGLSRGLVEDVRDALESILWYMRLEGGRYRFTTEPNLNKVVLEREGAISDTQVSQLVREALKAVLPEHKNGPAAVLRTAPWVRDSADLPDTPTPALGALDFDHGVDGPEATAATEAEAERVLEYAGSRYRTNKNAALLVIADTKAIQQARGAARTLAALTDISGDTQRLKRFNAEQKEILRKRLDAAQDRLPQTVVMAYRHLALLGETEGRIQVDRIDLGPARAGATITERVVEYLRDADRLIDKLAPAALLSPRFSVLTAEDDAVELDKLLSQFASFPRLPMLSGEDVLRACLADGVKQSIFGLVSGSDWKAEDSVLRFGAPVDISEIQFQPGTWLVRARAMEALVSTRTPKPNTGDDTPNDGTTVDPDDGPEPGESARVPTVRTGSSQAVRKVRVELTNVPAEKARDVVKAAILPLNAASVSTTFSLTIEADGGANGISRETIDLVVSEGLGQLGLEVEITEE